MLVSGSDQASLPGGDVAQWSSLLPAYGSELGVRLVSLDLESLGIVDSVALNWFHAYASGRTHTVVVKVTYYQ